MWSGFVPRPSSLFDGEAMVVAIGILDATVMPHNLYLHSSIVPTRHVVGSAADARDAITLATANTVVTLFLALIVNAAILVVAASAFHATGHTHVIGPFASARTATTVAYIVFAMICGANLWLLVSLLVRSWNVASSRSGAHIGACGPFRGAGDLSPLAADRRRRRRRRRRRGGRLRRRGRWRLLRTSREHRWCKHECDQRGITQLPEASHFLDHPFPPSLRDSTTIRPKCDNWNCLKKRGKHILVPGACNQIWGFEGRNHSGSAA